MMRTPLLNKQNRVRYLSWLSAGSLDARLATPNCRVVKAERLKISSCKSPIARLSLNSRSTTAAKPATRQLRFITPMPQSAAKSP
jgi:hypothetical protein